MTRAILLILVLANHGYWFGGQKSEITATWAVKADLPAAELVWQLSFNKTRLAQGAADIKAGDPSSTLTLAMPEVRVATRLLWSYTVKRKDNGETIQSGEMPVTVYPRNMFSDFSQRLKDRKLTIIDPQPDFAGVLTGLGVPNTRLSDTASLETLQTDLLLVTPAALGASNLVQGRLANQAARGASVAVLAQDVEKVMGYRLALRPMSALSFRENHPLLADLDAPACAALLRARPTVRAIALPADEPALEIVSFPRETPGHNPVPIDALLVTKTIGQGRIVMCQCPLPPPDQHPLSQIFYNNLLNYLLTRPEPTLKPSERQPPAAAATNPAPDLLPSFGAKP